MGIADWFRGRGRISAAQTVDPGAARQSHADIIAHMARHFGPVQELAITEVIPASGVTVHVIPARPGSNPLILFTTGMSDRPQTVPAGRDAFRYTELFVRLPDDWPLAGDEFRRSDAFWPIKWLKQIACYPHDNDTWLGGAYTIISNDEPPKPLAGNTRLSCLLLLREPDSDGTVQCRDGRTIAMYSITPLYREERDLEKAKGLPALFERLMAHDIGFVVDTKRVNAVTGK